MEQVTLPAVLVETARLQQQIRSRHQRQYIVWEVVEAAEKAELQPPLLSEGVAAVPQELGQQGLEIPQFLAVVQL